MSELCFSDKLESIVDFSLTIFSHFEPSASQHGQHTPSGSVSLAGEGGLIIPHCHLYDNLGSKFFKDIIRKYLHFNDLDDTSKIIFLFKVLLRSKVHLTYETKMRSLQLIRCGCTCLGH